ncbi:MAG: hypothetical protein ACQETO_02770 [Pseudomonadota bacterium]
MAFVILIAVMVVLMTLAVMLLARRDGARTAGFGRTLLAVSLQAALFFLTREFVPGLTVPALVAVLAGSVIYTLLLGMAFLKGLQIGVIAAILAVAGFVAIGRILASGVIPL